MSTVMLQRLLQMGGILLLQLLLLNHIHVLGYISPVLIGWLAMSFPRGSSRVALLLWGFAVGAVYDVFSNTLGMGMATATLCAMAQPALLQLYAPRDAADDMAPSFRTMTPSFRTMTPYRFSLYAATTMLLFHAVYYALDALMLRNWRLTLLAVGVGAALGLAIILIAEAFTQRRSGRSHS